jgi:hypothetical protein
MTVNSTGYPGREGISVLAGARGLPSPGFRVLSGQTLRQEARQRRSFQDQPGESSYQVRRERSREPE